VLNGQGEYAPLKNVIDIMPMEVDTIEFAASESGDWFFHCHILYHMMSGMGRIFSYENSPPNAEIPNPKKSIQKLYWDDRKPHFMAKTGVESNGIDGEMMICSTRWFGQAEWRLGYSLMDGFETETHIGRYFGKNQFFRLYIGGDFRYRQGMSPERNLFQQRDTKNNRLVACLGVQYVLPLLIVADLRVDHTGNVRFQLMREDIPLTRRLRLSFMGNTDLEYMLGLKYIVYKYVAVSTHYDSDMKWGAGVTVMY
jgi:hypothetical protein